MFNYKYTRQKLRFPAKGLIFGELHEKNTKFKRAEGIWDESKDLRKIPFPLNPCMVYINLHN